MERLTERDDKGNLLFNGKQVYAGDFYEAASCLEEYEDIGLDPDQIQGTEGPRYGESAGACATWDGRNGVSDLWMQGSSVGEILR